MTDVLRSVAEYFTPPSGQGRRTPVMIPVHARLVAFAVPGVLGSLGYLLLSDKGGRAALSFAGGIALTALVLTGGILAVRAGAVISPQMATLMALSTYVTVSIVLAGVLALSNPHVLDAPAFAVGLVVGVVVGIALQIRDARPPARRT